MAKPQVKKLPSYAFPACSTTSMMPGAFYCMEKKPSHAPAHEESGSKSLPKGGRKRRSGPLTFKA
jgi:hypothetical protein